MRIGLIHHPIDEFLLVNDAEQVRDLRDDPPHAGTVLSLNGLVQFGDAQSSHNLLLLLRITDGASVVLDAYRFACLCCVLCHDYETSLASTRIGIKAVP